MNGERGVKSERPRLLILGASTRAAAWSAARAGYQPVCADLFLDADLQAIAEVHPLGSYPEGFPEAVEELPPMAWMYTGGLENFPEIVDRISARHRLMGCGGDVLRRVRDPFEVNRILEEEGLPCPEVRSWENPPKCDGTWLCKPRRGSGGGGIRRWTEEAKGILELSEECFFQRYQAGEACSVLLMAGERGVEVLGMFEQLIGREEGESEFPEFGYRGSLFPARVSEQVRDQVARMGEVLAQGTGMRGAIGVDFVWDGEQAWPVEVNPRYTASVELWEAGTGRSLVREHLREFGECESTGVVLRREESARSGVWGKRIVYAPTNLQLGGEFAAAIAIEDTIGFPRAADLPLPGTRIGKGEPICSLLASGGEQREVLESLLREERELLERIGGKTVDGERGSAEVQVREKRSGGERLS